MPLIENKLIFELGCNLLLALENAEYLSYTMTIMVFKKIVFLMKKIY